MKRIRSARNWFAWLSVLLMPLPMQGGMAMPRLSDAAGARLDVISFFLATFLVLALVYQRLWNSLRIDFPKMPQLTYRGALSGLIVCSLFIYVVLTMISGARELLTPGAWVRSGVLYKIREPDKDPKPWLDTARRISLEKLRTAIWDYAAKHGGAFPANRESAEIPTEIWRTIDPGGLPFGYFPGLRADVGSEVLAYEPASFGAKRLTLLANGEIVEIDVDELTERVRAQIRALGTTSRTANK